jgi:tetratricopeptide (TPR) repeat protein
MKAFSILIVFCFVSTLMIQGQEIPELSITYQATDTVGPDHHYLLGLKFEGEVGNENSADNALAEYTKAISLDQNFLPAYLRRASILRFYLDEAIADLDKALKILDNGDWAPLGDATENDFRTEIYYLKAIFYSENKDYLNSIHWYNQASQLEPENTHILYRLGESYYFNGDFDSAITIFKELLETDSIYLSSSWLTLGKIYDQNERYQIAFKCYEMSIVRNPQNYLAYWNRAAMKEKLGDFIGARDDYTKVLQINPSAVNVYVDRAHLNLKLKDFVKAKSDVDKLLKYDSKSLAALKLKAHYYFTLKDRPNEIKAYDEILIYHPADKKILLKRGLAKLSIKRDGCPDLRKAGELGALEAFSFIKQYCNE